jgi:4-hydroxybenzoate polyprenyltransferase
MGNKFLRYLVFMLRIRRVEFRIAEIPIVAIPVLLLVHDASVLSTFAFWEGIFVFFLLFAFGDMINCLADRDLDSIYKPHLSESVYGLGVPFVTFQIVLTAGLAVLGSLHLAYSLQRPSLVALTVAGLVLGAMYSVEPFRLKGRGVLQLICLWSIIFVGPMLFVSHLVAAEISVGMLVFASAYGALQMGIILINTAEDYPEDLAAGVRTTIVSLGLHNGIGLAFLLTAVGAVGTLITLLWFYRSNVSAGRTIAGIAPFALAVVYVLFSIGRIRSRMASKDIDTSSQIVKRAAKYVPLWITIVAWSALWATGILFYFR